MDKSEEAGNTINMLTPTHVREVIQLKKEIDAQLIANSLAASVDVSNVHAGVREIVTEQYKSAGW